MLRLNCGSRETPKHPMKPGRSVFLSEVCLFLQDWGNQSLQPLSWQPKSLPSSVSFFSLFPLVLFCLPGVDGNGKSPSKSERHHLYLTEKYVWRWKQFLSRRGKRTSPLDLKLGHNNWLRQVSDPVQLPSPRYWAPSHIYSASVPSLCFFAKESVANIIFIITLITICLSNREWLRVLVAATADQSRISLPVSSGSSCSLLPPWPLNRLSHSAHTPLFSFRLSYLLLTSPSSS